MFRKELKVLDCTIRDGGLINNYHFTDDFVKAVYRAACDSGVDIIELGKKLAVSEEYPRDKFGKWNFCDDDDLKMVIDSHECENRPLVAVMFDIGRVDVDNLKPREQSPFDMARVACYVPDIDKGLDLVKRSKDMGYETTINGIGRGAGNCNLELLLNFLKNPKFDVEPIYKAIQDVFVPLRQEIEWGFNDIYGISGHLNQHPRAAMKLRSDKEHCDQCYDFLIESSRLDEGIIS
ncbi:MAG: hypothetical protein KZQ84_08965 [Candidatus Thiodiazotropha sp. (ex Lucinoma borealis)]|nr:hypothetical protein [Candidatus Thiodiazotropha sp. (ex Lucinoma borealis)]